MPAFRVYIDESGDHTYKHVDNLDTRYLGLTGIVIHKESYDASIQPKLEILKKAFFRYDPDEPTILVRSRIRHRKGAFHVLQDTDLNNAWEDKLIQFIASLEPHAQVFTVVMDKKVHLERYPALTFDPYAYSLAVLLNRIRGWLALRGEQADIMVEARGNREDQMIQQAYEYLRARGSHYGSAEYYQQAFPTQELKLRRKVHNIAGLQIADLIAFGQKTATVVNRNRPVARPLSSFTQRLNQAVESMVNEYGQYLLE